jgi:hypothetical protein
VQLRRKKGATQLCFEESAEGYATRLRQPGKSFSLLASRCPRALSHAQVFILNTIALPSQRSNLFAPKMATAFAKPCDLGTRLETV